MNKELYVELTPEQLKRVGGGVGRGDAGPGAGIAGWFGGVLRDP